MTYFKMVKSPEKAVVLSISLLLYPIVVQIPGRITELFISMSPGLKCGDPKEFHIWHF